MSSNKDVVKQELKLHDDNVTLSYVKEIVDPQLVQTMIVKPFFELKDVNDYYNYIESIMGNKINPTEDEIINGTAKGDVSVEFKKSTILVPAKKTRTDVINEATVESTIQGPRLAFSEDIVANLNLVRSRYQNPNLTTEMHNIGTKSKMECALVYDETIVNKAVLELVTKRLKSIQEPIMESTEKLQNMLNEHKLKLFPISVITERPDRVVYNIGQGKIIIFLDGTPFTLIAPAVFWDFMTSMDDIYQPFWISQFIRGLRYTGLLIGLLLPALYVGIVSYNPELLRTQLAISITASRQGVPYPSYVEVLFMLFMMELLIEASIRLPKSISATATTVGGLILGQAATEASLVSTIMIIIVSAVAISNFAIPLNHMSFAMRVLKYVLLLFGVFYGLIGIAIGLMFLLLYMANLSSFGEPYLKVHLQGKPNEMK
ncbi:spore germination protein [Salirhabdus salicampi]|uniref:spore germination protein n=1 Tax=Salirhabdus salicampi TaxID=476102 RepID=UPI0020C46ADF|nr:spore germination protein [Salirhabdus salicampi]MCP8615393.1 spore germination protein [Salirhabdus salicampi]